MGNVTIARLLGIPIVVNVSWLATLAFVTSILALQAYPELFPRNSPHRNDEVLHWAMAISSGIIFFASILLHELAHSIVARIQGIPVKNITLFIFGGVSQISGEAKRPLHEFIMAIIGPLTSVALAGVFFALWWLAGSEPDEPVAIVFEWLFLMNLIIAVFNMAPGFPMDGGRVLRAMIWGISGNLMRATQLATLLGRGVGYALIGVGSLAFFGTFEFINPWSGAWFVVLGLFLESSARQSWLQARALDALTKFKAEDIMSSELETADRDEKVQFLLNRGGKRFIFFVSDAERVVGVLTEKEARGVRADSRLSTTASDVMKRPEEVTVAAPSDDGSTVLQAMEAASVWHLPVVDDGRVVGVVSKENLLRLMARTLLPRRPDLVGQP
jgi:Zn-dependent protease/CBS domain-containing protein